MSTKDSIVSHAFGRIFSRFGIGTASRESKERTVPTLIPGGSRAPQLCMLPTDMESTDIMTGWAQLKVDGIRALYINGRIVTREGVPLDCALHCLPALRRIEEECGRLMVFDGEYVEEGGFDATVASFRRGTGEGVLWLFDAVPFDQWRVDACDEPIELRLDKLRDAALAADGAPFVGMLDAFELKTPKAVKDHVQHLWALNYEGAVIKEAGSRYTRRKSPTWRRWKETITMDCPVLDVLGPPGEIKGLIVRGPDGPLRVGSGFGAAEKKMIQSRLNWPMIVEIAYNRKAGSAKARHARFVRFRDDKRR